MFAVENFNGNISVLQIIAKQKENKTSEKNFVLHALTKFNKSSINRKPV